MWVKCEFKPVWKNIYDIQCSLFRQKLRNFCWRNFTSDYLNFICYFSLIFAVRYVDQLLGWYWFYSKLEHIWRPHRLHTVQCATSNLRYKIEFEKTKIVDIPTIFETFHWVTRKKEVKGEWWRGYIDGRSKIARKQSDYYFEKY